MNQNLPVESRVKLPLMAWADMRGQAEAFVKSGLAPLWMKTPEQALLVAAAGRELGVPFMASLRSIDVIQGQSSLSAQLKLAKAIESGELEDLKIERHQDCVTVELKRRGIRSYVKSRFGKAEAVAQRLDSKDNYQKQPFRMYKWRAISEALDVAFADVMLGVHRINDQVSPDVEGAPAEEPIHEPVATEPEIIKEDVESTPAPDAWPHPADTPPQPQGDAPPIDTEFMVKDITEKLAALNQGDVEVMEAHLKRLTIYKAKADGKEKWLQLQDLTGIGFHKPDWLKGVHKKVVAEFDREFGVQSAKGEKQ